MKIFRKLWAGAVVAGAIATLIIVSHPAEAQNWESAKPRSRGQIQDVVLDPLSDSRAFVLSDVEGLYHTADGGSSWQYSSRGLAGTNTLSLGL